MFPIVLWTALLFLVLVERRSAENVATAIDNTNQLNRIELDALQRDTVALPAAVKCADALCNEKETFIAYFTCCDEDETGAVDLNRVFLPEKCCRKIKFWFFPVTIATVGFTLGAVFAMCFQCR